MGFEVPKQLSPEEMAKIEKEKALSDAELVKDGAEKKSDEEGNKILEATDTNGILNLQKTEALMRC
jgi:hypothetical protein